MIHLVTCQLGLLRERRLPGWDARLSTGKLLGIRICASHSEAFLHYLQIPCQKNHCAEGDAGVASGIVVAQIAEVDYVGAAVACRTIVCRAKACRIAH